MVWMLPPYWLQVHSLSRPLYASSLSGTIRTLLEQTPHEEIQLLGCSALAEFINCQVQGIFRITPGNDPEEYIRDQLYRGVIQDDADVHCLACLIKAWFRELPTELLDSLSQEQLMESQTEEECVQLARTLPLTEASLLDWAVDLMADIAQHEHLNKMNPRNEAVVFAPNMTHVLDPVDCIDARCPGDELSQDPHCTNA